MQTFTWNVTLISDDFYHTFDRTEEITAPRLSQAEKIASDKWGDDVVNIDGPYVKVDVIGYCVKFRNGLYSMTYDTYDEAEDVANEAGLHWAVEPVFGT